MAEENSKQSNAEAVARLLGFFIQICVENQKQMTQKNYLKCFQLDHK